MRSLYRYAVDLTKLIEHEALSVPDLFRGRCRGRLSAAGPVAV